MDRALSGAELTQLAADAVGSDTGPILLWGEMGMGKSTLAAALGHELARRRGTCAVLGLDPGSPRFGPPGAVTAAIWSDAGFAPKGLEALCALDAARFRLPLVHASRRLIEALDREDSRARLLIDPPGVTRGTAGEELLTTLVESLKVSMVLALVRPGYAPPLQTLLVSLPVHLTALHASPRARRPSRAERAARRTSLWIQHLGGARREEFVLDDLSPWGTPPPPSVPDAWVGRQAALLSPTGSTLALGEVEKLEQGTITLRLPQHPPLVGARLLVRNAVRGPGGTLITAPRHSPLPATSPSSALEMDVHPAGPESSPVHCRVGWVWATLLGGVFGDPLLHVRLRHRRRSLLFDLGDAGRLSARLAHQVTDLFLSHAHLDHVGGFPWFLRSRLGPFFACRVFGPPGMIETIGHFLAAITWDRIGDNGAAFEVTEVHDDRLVRARLQPGRPRRDLPDLPVADGLILDESEFTVRAALCDHGIPALAYALTTRRELNVRKDRLTERGVPPGPWLAALKQAIWKGLPDTPIDLPDGTTWEAAALAEDLVLVSPGKTLAYAADAADTPDNRSRLIDLAQGAHTFFCEASFTTEDQARAAATQHLTARAAAEIARAAGAERLAPFHFSRRYERDPSPLWAELHAAAGPVALIGAPQGIPS